MEEEKKEYLYIPLGLKNRVEIFEGFGKEELVQAFLFNIIAGVVDIILYLVFRNIASAFLFMMISIATSVMALTKDKSNTSILDQVRYMVQFKKGQKYYPYRALDEWGMLNLGEKQSETGA